jgi:hypothetical protein
MSVGATGLLRQDVPGLLGNEWPRAVLAEAGRLFELRRVRGGLPVWGDIDGDASVKTRVTPRAIKQSKVWLKDR